MAIKPSSLPHFYPSHREVSIFALVLLLIIVNRRQRPQLNRPLRHHLPLPYQRFLTPFRRLQFPDALEDWPDLHNFQAVRNHRPLSFRNYFRFLLLELWVIIPPASSYRFASSFDFHILPSSKLPNCPLNSPKPQPNSIFLLNSFFLPYLNSPPSSLRAPHIVQDSKFITFYFCLQISSGISLFCAKSPQNP